MTTDRGNPYVTIVLSIPGVGRWVWDEAFQLVEFYPHNKRYPAHSIPLGMECNTAEWALRKAAKHTSTPEFAKAWDPGTRLRRFKDG